MSDNRCLYCSFLERETGIEPATNSLEGCDSTTELLPLSSRLRRVTIGPSTRFARSGHDSTRPSAPAMSEARRAESNGGEGRTRTFEAARATDLQSAAFDRFATSPTLCVLETCVIWTLT